MLTRCGPLTRALTILTPPTSAAMPHSPSLTQNMQDEAIRSVLEQAKRLADDWSTT